MSDEKQSRSSISVGGSTKDRFDALRRQLAAQENRDMTGDDTLTQLLDYFEEDHDWVDTRRNSGDTE